MLEGRSTGWVAMKNRLARSSERAWVANQNDKCGPPPILDQTPTPAHPTARDPGDIKRARPERSKAMRAPCAPTPHRTAQSSNPRGTEPNWHLQCYTYNRHYGSQWQCLDRAGTGVFSAFQCPALGWHWSAQCPPAPCFPTALQCPSAPVPHRNGHPKSKFRVEEGRGVGNAKKLR